MAARRKIPWTVPDPVLLDEDFVEDVNDLVESIRAGHTLQIDDTGGLIGRRNSIGGNPAGEGEQPQSQRGYRHRGRPRRRRIPRLDG